uniref:Uncharacterized protein n=1 Tax=viral metagenome TaxID=1070528 RepID=A0A6C0DTD2_9ZZZZ
MPQSTPLEKIETNEIPDGQASDEERVQRIIHEMNSGDAEPVAPGPAYHQQGPPQYQPMPGNPVMGRPMAYQAQYDAPVQQQPAPEPADPVVAKKNIFAHITDAFKLPLVVAIVFFLFSLPVVDLHLAKYVPWAFSSGGHLSIPGLAIKALAAGAVMGLYDTIDKLVSRLF